MTEAVSSIERLSDYVRQVTRVSNNGRFPLEAIALLNQDYFPGHNVWIIKPHPLSASVADNDRLIAAYLERLTRAAMDEVGLPATHRTITDLKSSLAALPARIDDEETAFGKPLADRFELLARYSKLLAPTA